MSTCTLCHLDDNIISVMLRLSMLFADFPLYLGSNPMGMFRANVAVQKLKRLSLHFQAGAVASE